MSGRELADMLHYIGMEKNMRKLVIDEKIATAEDVACMSCMEVCECLLQEYEVVASENERVIVVRKSDMETYGKIAKELSR